MGIIGISGKKQTGKDTVAKIIQGFDIYQTNKKVQQDYSFNNHFVRDYVLGKVNPFPPSSYEIKKFAGKLKQIVSIITGYSLEELEQEDIKNKVLFQWRKGDVISSHLQSFCNSGLNNELAVWLLNITNNQCTTT